ncbi:Uncharacterised protein [Mycobacteroides abscessus subsp. bolletii]|nr:Uncharacterised protein [Mycobacteroides abscessus subsp. bolletii]SKF80463.1 Uncharacterised protein [Mycobacteroides abscessus subsp. bolletii]SKG30357.1 Uncharacterised protein [Mycobacteroides abscessus subsp. bolletii]SKG48572.1 Uncharacterised protein [Mycobacteroides abscessus subsp. bolletii]SKG84874.1 Uncharacterised protein [Mycobacteroides abscessus subsp. bolletii]
MLVQFLMNNSTVVVPAGCGSVNCSCIGRGFESRQGLRDPRQLDVSGFDSACAAAVVGFQRRTPAAAATGVADHAARAVSA